MNTAVLAAIAVTFTLTVLTLRYIGACYVKPFTACWKCHGSRRIPNRIGNGWHDCRRCDGTGLRLRWGRHAINLARRIYREGTR